MQIRLARIEDLTPIAQVYHASIAELCSTDYDQDVILAWLNTSKPESRQQDIESGCLWVVESFSRSTFDLESNNQPTTKPSLEQNNRYKGLAGFMAVAPGELMSLFIHPAYSGLGVGKKLAEIGIQFAKKGHHSIRLESTLNTVPFYQKLGFVEKSHGFFSHGNTTLNIPIVNMILTFSH